MCDFSKIAVSCVNAELLQLDADAELLIAVARVLQHSVFESEVDVLDADLKIVENSRHQLVCE